MLQGNMLIKMFQWNIPLPSPEVVTLSRSPIRPRYPLRTRVIPRYTIRHRHRPNFSITFVIRDQKSSVSLHAELHLFRSFTASSNESQVHPDRWQIPRPYRDFYALSFQSLPLPFLGLVPFTVREAIFLADNLKRSVFLPFHVTKLNLNTKMYKSKLYAF